MYSIQSEVGSTRYFWIPNFGGAYVVGDEGSVWSRKGNGVGGCSLTDNWRKLSPAKNRKTGYLHVILYWNRIRYTKEIHQLVCEAVHGLCPVGEEVRHKDGVKFNNNWWNLHYGTKKDNKADMVIHGTYQNGENATNVKLSWVKVREIRAKWSIGKHTYRSLGLEYGVSASSVYDIVNDLRWVEHGVCRG
jgi:hypothetical protein